MILVASSSLLIIPLFFTVISDEFNWSFFDFIIMGFMMIFVGNLFEWLSDLKKERSKFYISRGTPSVSPPLESPLWLALNPDCSDDFELYFDKYPFFDTSGMYDYGKGKSKFFKSEFSTYSFNNSIYGGKSKIDFQNQRHIFSYSYINFKENYNDQIINKNIIYLMYSNMFSLYNNKTSNLTLGFGLSTWNSESYKDKGLIIRSSFNKFLKPFSLNLNLGYSFMGENLIDLETKLSYHYKRLSFSLGYQRFQVLFGELIKGKTYTLGFWF